MSVFFYVSFAALQESQSTAFTRVAVLHFAFSQLVMLKPVTRAASTAWLENAFFPSSMSAVELHVFSTSSQGLSFALAVESGTLPFSWAYRVASPTGTALVCSRGSNEIVPCLTDVSHFKIVFDYKHSVYYSAFESTVPKVPSVTPFVSLPGRGVLFGSSPGDLVTVLTFIPSDVTSVQ